jgi:hypothetical protein
MVDRGCSGEVDLTWWEMENTYLQVSSENLIDRCGTASPFMTGMGLR